jgi:hypothetical protein
MVAYQLRTMVTARIAGYITIDADTEELAIEQAHKTTADEIVFRVDDDFHVEGDLVGFIKPEYDGTPETENADEIELDLREDGEPRSWMAVEIVKEMAKLGDKATPEQIDALIQRSIEACKKDTQ